MTIFIDTSAFLAGIAQNDINHQRARKIWNRLLTEDNPLVTTNYVLLESIALMQKRIGLNAVREFQDSLLPLLNIEWIDKSIHKIGIASLLTVSRRRLSLVDCVSFEVMRKLSIKTAFAFDPHFKEQGFNTI